MADGLNIQNGNLCITDPLDGAGAVCLHPDLPVQPAIIALTPAQIEERAQQLTLNPPDAAADNPSTAAPAGVGPEVTGSLTFRLGGYTSGGLADGKTEGRGKALVADVGVVAGPFYATLLGESSDNEGRRATGNPRFGHSGQKGALGQAEADSNFLLGSLRAGAKIPLVDKTLNLSVGGVAQFESTAVTGQNHDQTGAKELERWLGGEVSLNLKAAVNVSVREISRFYWDRTNNAAADGTRSNGDANQFRNDLRMTVDGDVAHVAAGKLNLKAFVNWREESQLKTYAGATPDAAPRIRAGAGAGDSIIVGAEVNYTLPVSPSINAGFSLGATFTKGGVAQPGLVIRTFDYSDTDRAEGLALNGRIKLTVDNKAETARQAADTPTGF